MNLGHGRAGHLPDYSFIRYEYLPAWGGYRETVKDNPSDYLHAFCQMIEAMKYLRGERQDFGKERYDWEAIKLYRAGIDAILRKRQLDACTDWKAFGEKPTGQVIEDFDIEKYQQEYLDAKTEEKDDSFLGKYFLAALQQKSMVTAKVFQSGNLSAGFSVNYMEKGFKGIRDFRRLIRKEEGEKK